MSSREDSHLADGLVVALDPAYLPGLIAAEAELERKAENERFRIWEAGFTAGQRSCQFDRLDQGYPKNPYQWHGVPS